MEIRASSELHIIQAETGAKEKKTRRTQTEGNGHHGDVTREIEKDKISTTN